MKDLTYHNENSCSLYGVFRTWEDYDFVRAVFRKLISLGPFALVDVQRPFVKVEATQQMLNRFSTWIYDHKAHPDYWACSFKYKSEGDIESFVRACEVIWFEYEQPAFAFFINKKDLEENSNFLNSKTKSWRESLLDFPCYVLYRGIEEEVIWFEKTPWLSFTFLDEIVKNN